MMFRPFQFKPPHDKLGKIFAAVNEISKWKLTVIENPPSIESIISTARSAKETKGALIVDYLQLIPDGDLGRKQDSRERRIAAMSAQLRALAIELKWPIIALSQLNDDGQIRESRAVGHDAEIVLEVQDDGIHVHKNRNGQRGQTLTITLEKSASPKDNGTAKINGFAVDKFHFPRYHCAK
jgi:replicative DNA helicase